MRIKVVITSKQVYAGVDACAELYRLAQAWALALSCDSSTHVEHTPPPPGGVSQRSHKEVWIASPRGSPNFLSRCQLFLGPGLAVLGLKSAAQRKIHGAFGEI